MPPLRGHHQLSAISQEELAMPTIELTAPIEDSLIEARITRFGRGAPYKAGQVVNAARHLLTGEGARQPGNWLLNLGAYSYSVTGNPTLLKMSTGRFCSLAAGLEVADGKHPLYWASTSPFFYSRDHAFDPDVTNPRHANQSYGPVTIGHDVWVGRNTTLKAGLNIGHGAVVAFGSVVVHDVEPYTIVGGNPARVIRPRFDESIIEELLASQWWDFPPEALSTMPVHDTIEFLKECRLMSGERYIYREVSLNS